MPVTVTVRSASPPGASHAENEPSLTFDGSRIVLGRGSGSDVRLPDPSVSPRHATIRAQGNDYAIVDEGSTNGTWVGEVRLLPSAPQPVKSGDLVRVGRVWLELAIGKKAATPELGLATRELAFALVERAMEAVGDETVARVRITEGPDIGEELSLVEQGRAYVIGRAETCDLTLSDADASREHAVVARRGGQILLRDLGSRNGVFLGEQRLTPDRDVVWRAPAIARIGLTVFALEEPVSRALAELEAAVDERMRDDDAPPRPDRVAPPAPSDAATSATGAVAEAPTASVKEPPSAPQPPDEVESTNAMPRRPRGRRGWAATDFLVVALAIVVIGASVAGLLWVLR